MQVCLRREQGCHLTGCRAVERSVQDQRSPAARRVSKGTWRRPSLRDDGPSTPCAIFPSVCLYLNADGRDWLRAIRVADTRRPTFAGSVRGGCEEAHLLWTIDTRGSMEKGSVYRCWRIEALPDGRLRCRTSITAYQPCPLLLLIDHDDAP